MRPSNSKPAQILATLARYALSVRLHSTPNVVEEHKALLAADRQRGEETALQCCRQRVIERPANFPIRQGTLDDTRPKALLTWTDASTRSWTHATRTQRAPLASPQTVRIDTFRAVHHTRSEVNRLSYL